MGSTMKTLTDRDVIAKAIHTNGECGWDGGTWEQVKQSGYKCGCSSLAARIVRFLNKHKRLRGAAR